MFELALLTFWKDAGFCVLIGIGATVLLLACYRKPSQGQAIVRRGLGGLTISFSGLLVIPILHRFEFLDLTLKRLVFDVKDADALVCGDGVKADIQAAFFVRINATETDVLNVIQTLGLKDASDVGALTALFAQRFLTGLRGVASAHSFERLSEREFFKQQLIQTVGDDLDGYCLDTVTIDYFEKTKTA